MEEELFCVCRKPAGYNRFMIECTKCKNWFHGSCVSVKKSQKTPDTWLCPNCVKECNEGKDSVSKADFEQASNEIKILKGQMSNVLIVVKSLVNQSKTKEKCYNEKDEEVTALRAECDVKDKEIRILKEQCDKQNEEKEVHEECIRKLKQELDACKKGMEAEKEACQKQLESVKESYQKELEAVIECCKKKEVENRQLLVKLQLWQTKYEELNNSRCEKKTVVNKVKSLSLKKRMVFSQPQSETVYEKMDEN
ncbi:putative E3 ubiquitin-protein ligase ubr7 [Thrips palmi]|uniref:E3 ubiquitin-protein ligase ubr7 n=1 Tax=Thrips palmi TaxID=161013 RepID=A0A6P9A7X9_THRPL|nr:putative E3 ubiquitin-protein ligase ubr7 [Thrips palmi]